MKERHIYQIIAIAATSLFTGMMLSDVGKSNPAYEMTIAHVLIFIGWSVTYFILGYLSNKRE